MEPEAAAFLKRVGKSMSLAFLWLALTCVFAIKGDNAFVTGSIRLGNVLFYLYFFASILALVFFIRKMWSDESIEKERQRYNSR